MSKARNISDLLDANGDVKSGALDNVPASDDASALTTGTLPNARLASVPNSALANSAITINGSATSLGSSISVATTDASSLTSGTLPNARLASIPNSALANPSITINGNATALGGSATVGGDKLSRQVNLASGASVTDAKIINTNQSGEIEQYPTMNTVGTYSNDQNLTDYNYVYSRSSDNYRVRYVTSNVSNKSRITITGEVFNTDGSITVGSSATLDTDSNGSTSSSGGIGQWKDNYWTASSQSGRSGDGDSTKGAVQMFTVNPSNGNISMLGTRYTMSDNHDRGSNTNPRYGGGMGISLAKGAPSIYFGEDQFRRNVQVRHFKNTTSGLTNQQNWSYNTYNPTYSGTNRYSQNGTGDTHKTTDISSSRRMTISSTGFTTYDFSGVGGTQTSLASYPFQSNEYYGEGNGIFLNNTHFIYFFRDIYAKRRAQTYSFSNTSFTKIDDFEYDDLSAGAVFGSISDIRPKSTTEIALKTNVGLSAIELDSSYNILGMKTPLAVSGLTGDMPYVSGNIFLSYNTAPDSTKLVAPYTINAYRDDFPFIYGGVSQETSSSGTAEIAYGGIADGFTGLTVGQKYYVDANLNGNITTATTSGIVVGTAISPTEILLGDVR